MPATGTNIQGSETVALVPSGENLLAGHPGGLPSRVRFEKPAHGKFPVGVCSRRWRQMRDDSAMARDGNRRTTFNLTKKSGQMRFRLCRLNVNHVSHRPSNRTRSYSACEIAQRCDISEPAP